MGFRFEKVLIILFISASVLAVGMANRNVPSGETNQWNNGFNHTDNHWSKQRNATATHRSASKRIIVGGSEKWHFGFNYIDWSYQNFPIYINDTLVFKYDPPNGTTFPHSVYLLPDFLSFLRCDLTKAKRVAAPSQGGGDGFGFVLKKSQTYYFACGEKNGFHCKTGKMKFFVKPQPCPSHF